MEHQVFLVGQPDDLIRVTLDGGAQTAEFRHREAIELLVRAGLEQREAEAALEKVKRHGLEVLKIPISAQRLLAVRQMIG